MNLRKYLLIALISGACANVPQKVMLDSSTIGKPAPDWAQSTEVNWTNGKSVYFKAHYSVLGNERLNGCYQLAELDAKQALLTEISEDLFRAGASKKSVCPFGPWRGREGGRIV